MYPIFIHVSRKNADKDRAASTCHITCHFHDVTKFLQKTFWISVLLLILVLAIYNNVSKKISGSIIMLIPLLYLFILTVTMIEHILLSVLAIQRCLLFFFEWSVDYITLSDKGWSRLIKFLYIYMFLFNSILRVVKAFMIPADSTFSLPFIEFMNFYNSLDMLYIPSILLLSAALAQLNEDLIFSAIIWIDILTTHFIIQTSYLISNRSNMTAALAWCGFSRYSDVAPYTVQERTTNF
ncbi:hypothetical protein GCK72_019896 [Caenorhabditis remanei]|nr:hypothetical protein GCK72_019896 [Caenorhabditis remanei]KAF1753340.1 hypothetical protein GCK72_019896 [Caenorhabditis remanei]